MASTIFLRLAVCLFFYFASSRRGLAEARCVMYKECSEKRPCVYNGTDTPILEDPEALDTIKVLCPYLLSEGKPPELCCDASQVDSLARNLVLPQMLFGRCPSCLENFQRLWCYFTCSPEQSRFLNITGVDAQGLVVTNIDYHMSERFATTAFNSCRSVQNPSSSERAISIMCNGQKDDDCNVTSWLQFLGHNPFSPFYIDFVLHEEPDANSSIVPLDVTTFACSEAPDNNTLACSCQDCPAMCKMVDPYPVAKKSHCYVGSIDCMVLVSIVLCLCVFAIIIVLIAAQCVITGTPMAKSAGVDRHSFGEMKCCGRETILTPGDVSIFTRGGFWLETKLGDAFHRWGIICTRHPMFVFLIGFIPSLICSVGVYYMQITTDPVQIWSSPGSRARMEKDFFDQNFEPFYRIEQLIIVPTNQSAFPVTDMEDVTTLWGPVFRKEILHEVLDLQKSIEGLVATWKGRSVSLGHVCVKPLAPEKDKCLVQSVLGYFQGDPDKLDKESEFGEANWLTHIQSCVEDPFQMADRTELRMPCLAEYGGPVYPYVVLGGFNGTNYVQSEALVVTYLVHNYNDERRNDEALAWEEAFVDFVSSYKSANISISFKAERSIEDEIRRESHGDVATILISYCVMFVYIAVALGQYRVYDNNLATILVRSKILLGLLGVLVVLLSVLSSLGFYAYIGIPTTLISIEVVPFLVLAVGVDNIFILVQSFQRRRIKGTELLEEQVASITAEVIPTMLLSSFSEGFCFFLGALSSMPAVKVFSLYAALAIFFDFFLQITCFLALFAMDVRRENSGRLEICCCVRVDTDNNESDGFLQSIIRDFYTPFLMSKPVRIAVLFIFSAWLFSSVAVVNKIELGLDEKLSMPQDSYMQDYFEAMNRYLAVGPPVYFVVDGDFDYADSKQQNKLCGSVGCDEDSLYGQVHRAALYPNRSYIAAPVSSWLDDYIDWLRPVGRTPCCRRYASNGSFCPATVDSKTCHSCAKSYSFGRPNRHDFTAYLPIFLADNPTINCSKGGHAAYVQSVVLKKGRVVTSNFMTYHSVLKSSADFIAALVNAREIAANITEVINRGSEKKVRVFPYSIFYVFYEQYLGLVWDAAIQLMLSLGAIFIVSAILMGLDVWSSSIIVFVISAIVLNLMGLMYWWGIAFNAVSLVNLVMAVGISVEFCAHLTRGFVSSTCATRVERATDALENVGSSVLSGITLTKFGGIVVLAFSHSQIFQVFYFRMYLGIVLFGAAHGLIFLPVFLSFVGPSLNALKMYEEQSNETAAAGTGQRYRVGTSGSYASSTESVHRSYGDTDRTYGGQTKSC